MSKDFTADVITDLSKGNFPTVLKSLSDNFVKPYIEKLENDMEKKANVFGQKVVQALEDFGDNVLDKLSNNNPVLQPLNEQAKKIFHDGIEKLSEFANDKFVATLKLVCEQLYKVMTGEKTLDSSLNSIKEGVKNLWSKSHDSQLQKQ